MKISARVQNSEGQQHVALRTNDNVHSLTILPRPAEFGSRLKGNLVHGELGKSRSKREEEIVNIVLPAKLS